MRRPFCSNIVNLVLHLWVLLLVPAAVQAQFAGGDGSPESPWIITERAHLEAVGGHLDGHFLLGADINLNDGPWQPIGYLSGSCGNPFTGRFDGAGHALHNVEILMPDSMRLGLFSCLQDAEITNLKIFEVDIEGIRSIGGIAGYALRSVISKVYVMEVDIFALEDAVGGLVGDAEQTVISNSNTYFGRVAGGWNVGGLAGLLQQDVHGSHIVDSYAQLDVEGGALSPSVPGQHAGIGGLVGYATHSTITRSYAQGHVTGAPEADVGGLVGTNWVSTISASFWDRDMSGTLQGVGYAIESSVDLTGLTSLEMDAASAFSAAGWDSANVWLLASPVPPNFRWVQSASHNITPVVLAPIGDQQNRMLEDIAIDASAHFVDPELGPLTFSAVVAGSDSLPEGLSIDAGTGVISGKALALQDVEIQVTVTESGGLSAMTAFDLVVLPFFAGGDGSESDPWQIEDSDQLNAIRFRLDDHYELVADIDLDQAPWNVGVGWQPIGTLTESFTGSLDGNDHKIINLFIDRPEENDVGLFGELAGASVRNLTLESVDITGKDRLGALSGYAWDSELQQVRASGTVTGHPLDDESPGAGTTGGLIGYAGGTRLHQTGFEGRVAGEDYVGGLVGTLDEGEAYLGRISESFMAGHVTGRFRVGGLVGLSDEGSLILDSYARADVIGVAQVGGLAGEVIADGTIRRSYANSAISSEGTAGTLVGHLAGAIERSFWNADTQGERSAVGTMTSGGLTESAGLPLGQLFSPTPYMNSGWTIDGSIWAYPVAHLYHSWSGPISFSLPPVPAPVIADQHGLLDHSFTFDLSDLFIDPDGDALNFSIHDLPEGLSLDSTTGILSGTPATLGTHTLLVTADDSAGTEASASFTLTVRNFSAGTGSSDAPWAIRSADQLDAVRHELDAHFILADDIDLDVAPFNTGSGWEPIGDESSPFTGSFDGDGHVISNLFIEDEVNHVGLFGFVLGADISSTGLEAAAVSGADYVGGLAGYVSESSISSSFVHGDVTGQDHVGGMAGYISETSIDRSHVVAAVIAEDAVGGLVGSATVSSVISDSFARGSVSAEQAAGGLVATLQNSQLRTSYAINTVEGDSFRALVASGYDDSSVSSTYWTSALKPWIQPVGPGITAIDTVRLSLDQMQASTNFSELWDFENVWMIDEGSSYPYHRWSGPTSVNSAPVQHIPFTSHQLRLNQAWINMGLTGLFIDPDLDDLTFSTSGLPEGLTFEGTSITGSSDDVGLHAVLLTAEDPSGATASFVLNLRILPFATGSGTTAAPWLIDTADQLSAIRDHLTAHFRLNADINLADAIWSDEEGWEPLGSADAPFTGSFEGDHHEIQGLTINRPEESGVGLFGRTEDAEIRNITLMGVSVVGLEEAGALVGSLHGSTLSGVSVTGDIGVMGIQAGGIVGRAHDSGLSESYFHGQVVAADATARYIGGIAGGLEVGSSISDSHVQAVVTGGRWAGGIVGLLADSTISSSFSEAAMTVSADPGALAGSIANGVIAQSYWNAALVDGLAATGGGIGDTAGSAGLEPAELRSQDNLVGFDFAGAWFIHQAVNQGYPILERLKPSHIPPFFSAMADVLGAIDEDAELTFNFGELTALTNAEGSDAPLDAFEVISVPSGTLYIGGQPYDAADNARISGDQPVRWTPAADANGQLPALTLVAADTTGAVSATEITAMVDVAPVNDAPRLLTSVPDQTGTQDVAFMLDLGAHFVDVENDALTFTVAGLPAELALNEEGVITGTPDNAVALDSPYSVSVTVRDPHSAAVTEEFTLAIVNVNDAPDLLDTIPDQHAVVGELFNLDVAPYFEDIDREVLAYTATGLPAELALDEDGLISGTPVAGRHDVMVTVTDGEGDALSENFVILSLSFTQGEGSEESPWEISTPTLLNEMRFAPDAYFVLTADIDLGGDDPEGVFWNGGEGWLPIGTLDDPFTGRLDGSGHVISGLYINRPADDNLGLFGTAQDAQVSNLGLEAAAITGNASLAALVGNAASTNIDEVYVTGNVNGFMSVGGIVGNLNGGMLSRSYSRAAIASTFFSGVLVAQANHAAVITETYAAGSITGMFVGALIGGYSNVDGELSNSYWLASADELAAIGQDDTGTQAPVMLTVQEMRAGNSFSMWNFSAVWALSSSQNDGYPILRWQLPPTSAPNPNIISSTVSNPTLRGNITVTSNGVLNGGNITGKVNNRGLINGNLVLGPESSVEGGTIAGTVVGSTDSPARIVAARVNAGARLENVVIGSGTMLDPGVQIGANVRFDSNSLIPPGLNLTDALNKMQWVDGDAREVVDLQGDVIADAEQSLSLIEAIQQLNEFEPSGNQILQRSDNGELYVAIGGISNAVLPIQISQAALDEPEGISINEDGDIVFVTINRRVIISHPVLSENLAFQQQAEAMGLALSFDNRTNLVLTDQGNSMPFSRASQLAVSALGGRTSYFVGRPDVAAVPAYRAHAAGLVSYAVPGIDNIEAVSILFESDDGTLVQQDIAPVPADWLALKDVLKQIPGATDVQIDLQGVITLRESGHLIRARVDYQVWKNEDATSGEMRYEEAGDLNGDGLADFMLHYPNGDRQALYLYP